MIKFFGNLHSKIMLFIVGMYSYETEMDVNYSHYLGPSYKRTMSKKVPATLVANHVSFLDVMIFASRSMPSIAANDGVSKMPLVSILGNAFGNLSIPRGGTKEARE